MGAHHGHEHARFDADRRALSIALALIACLMVGGLVAGIVAQSLALLADAGHLLSLQVDHARASVVQLSTVERRVAD